MHHLDNGCDRAANMLEDRQQREGEPVVLLPAKTQYRVSSMRSRVFRFIVRLLEEEVMTFHRGQPLL